MSWYLISSQNIIGTGRPVFNDVTLFGVLTINNKLYLTPVGLTALLGISHFCFPKANS